MQKNRRQKADDRVVKTLDSENKRTLIVAHGDLDGITSAVLVARQHEDREFVIRFALPQSLDSLQFDDDCDIFVIDIAVNNRDSSMTKRFIERAGGRLKRWYDHHRGWEGFTRDDRFRIDESAPACAVIIGGDEALVADAIAADTRNGSLSERGTLIERAIKAGITDDSVREAAFLYLLLGNTNSFGILEESEKKYAQIENTTNELSKAFMVSRNIALVDARDCENHFDLTRLLLNGYKHADFSIVMMKNILSGEDTLTIATRRKDVDLLELLGLESGASFRATVPAERKDEILEKLGDFSKDA